jgi:hypothetical protein
VATNNTVQYTITAKDQASAVFAQVATKAKGVGANIAESFAVVGAAAFAMRGVVSDGFKVMTGDFSKLGSLFGSIPGPIGVVGQAVGDTLGKMLQSTVDAAEGFRKLSERTGATVEFLSGFTEAADDMFIKSDTVSAALGIFAKKLGGVEDAMDGSGISAGAFAKKLSEIGINTDNVEEALLTVADRFKDMKDGTEKTALAVQLFGKQGAELIPILNKGRDGINEMSSAAKEMGLVMTSDTVKAVQDMKKAQDELNDTWEGASRRIMAQVIPALNEMGKRLTDPKAFRGDALVIAKTNFDAYNKAVKEAALGTREYGEWALRAEQPLRDLTHTTVDMGTALENIDGPTRTVNQLWSETSEAMRIATIKEYDAKEAAEQLAAKQQALADATNNVNSAFGGTPKAMDNAEKAMALFSLNTGGTTKAQFEQKQAMEAIRDALDKGIISYADAAKALIGLRDGTLTTEDAFRKAGAAGAFYRDETEKLIAASDKLKPKEVTLTVHNRWDDGEGVWDRYIAAQDKTVTVRFNMVQGTNVESDTGGNTRARGGPVKKSRPYLVGEQGPEMFVPYASGYIVPNSQTPYTDPGTKVNQSFNVNNPSIIINSANGAAIAQQIARQNLNVARRARARASLTG